MKTILLLFTAILFAEAGKTQSWLTTGNSGTDIAINFLGTTDNKPLIFKINNVERMRMLNTGKIGIGTKTPQSKLDVNGDINVAANSGFYIGNIRTLSAINYNTALGLNSLANNTSGYYNTANGYYSLYNNTSGFNNTAIGYTSLYFNTTGYQNTACGFNALRNNTIGNSNTAYGMFALSGNVDGYSNTSSGYSALFNNTNGFQNCAFGNKAMLNNQTGSSNVAIGNSTLYHSQSTNENVAIGDSALYNSSTGNYMVAIGSHALFNNLDGFANTALGWQSLAANTNGNSNTAIGSLSLLNNIAGRSNTVTGFEAMQLNSTGSNNTGIGVNSLYSNNGDNNTSVGFDALDINVSGSNNTAIGVFAGPSTTSYSNTTSLGYQAYTSADNQVRIGNGSVVSIGGSVNWTSFSDGRIKKNIQENVPGLSFINKLKPITYNLNLEAVDKIILPITTKEDDNKRTQSTQQITDGRKFKEAVVYTGFIAQDVEKAAKSLNYDFSGVDVAKNDKDLYGLRYAEFVVPLVKAVQQLSKLNDEKDSAINNLQQQINELKGMIVSGNSSLINSQQSVSISSAMLAQNIPNPFSNNTIINYIIPAKYSSAKIIITGKNGNVFKQINIAAKGKGSVSINTSSLAAGSYNYSLWIDGKLIDTKQMMLTK